MDYNDTTRRARKRDIKVGVPKPMLKRISETINGGSKHRISDPAHHMISDTVIAVLTKVVFEAHKLQISSKPSRKTITDKSIISAVKIVFPPELGRFAVGSIVDATSAWKKSSAGSNKMDTYHRISKQDKRTFVVASRVMDKFSCLRKSQLSRIALSGVCEYILDEIMEISYGKMMDDKKVTMSDRHVFLAFENDQELRDLRQSVAGVAGMGGGVVPHIHGALLYKRK